jgi:hypothetical protein
MLKSFSTRQLVEELSTREGVERIDVLPHTQSVEVAVNENNKYLYDKMDTGPAIILWIID